VGDIFVGVVLAFFAIAVLFVYACQLILGSPAMSWENALGLIVSVVKETNYLRVYLAQIRSKLRPRAR
jgi:hypothetical protein